MARVFIHAGKKHEYFQSDLMIHKESVGKTETFNEVLMCTIYGYPKDLRMITSAQGRIAIIEGSERNKTAVRYYIPSIEDYQLKEVSAGEGKMTRLTIKKKKETFIRKEKEGEKQPNYPFIINRNGNKKEQISKIYNLVKNNVVTPMFPNVEESILMASELKEDKETAKEILELIRENTPEHLVKIEKETYRRAKKLLSYLSQWKEYLFKEMKENELIKEVDVAFSEEKIEVFEIIVEQEKIKQIIQNGVRNGDIEFTDKKIITKDYRTFDKYMPVHAPDMRERIERIAEPKHRKGEISPEIMYWMKGTMKRNPLGAQEDTITASIKAMFEKGSVNVIGECGVGKTYIMIASNFIYNRIKNQTMKLLVLSPDTLVETVWKEEIGETLYDVETHEIKSIKDLMEYEKLGYLDDDQDRAFILSQTNAKSGYSLKPAVNWGPITEIDKKEEKVRYLGKGFSCPSCHHPVMHSIENKTKDPSQPKYIDVPVPFTYFDKHRNANHKCEECDTVLWEPYNKDAKKNRFVYCKELKGFFPKDKKEVRSLLEGLVAAQGKATSQKEKDKITREIAKFRALEMVIKGTKEEGRRSSPKKVPVADYIFKKLRYRFTNLIIDEFHEFQGNSARSDACAKIVNSVNSIQTGTGTGMNGYAKSRFKTDYMLYPEKMKAHGFTIHDKERYQAMFGVTEKRWRLSREKGKDKKATLSPVAKPGISPVIFPMFMQDTTVFLSLQDLKDDLPPLWHYQIEVEPDKELLAAKKQWEDRIRKVTMYDKKLFRSSVQANYSFLDAPTKKKYLRDPNNGNILAESPTVSNHNDNKLKELLKLLKQEVVNDGNRVIVYTYFTGDQINEYLGDHIRDRDLKVTVLNRQDDHSISCDGTETKVNKVDREKYIREEVKKGTEVLIVNPELIKTGYNLIDFSTIVYYQMGYQVYTNRQADRRTWRIGQKNECKIIYIYYKDSIQQDIASLMATKIVASQAIEGNMDAAGLDAITNVRTAEEELSKMFYEGLREEVPLNSYSTGKITA